MKVEFDEWDQGCQINLIPETVEETAQLLRMSQNTRREPTTVSFRYRKDVYCNIFMRKRNIIAQKFEVNNRKS
jgi:hypothetical protein